MKRTWIAILLIIAIMLCCTGCDLPLGQEDNAYAIVYSAMQKTKALDSAHMILEMKSGVSVAGVSLSVPMEYDIKAVGLTGDSPKMNMTVKMDVLGVDLDMDFYIEDGYYYMTYLGQNLKFKAESMEEYNGFGQIASVMPDLNEIYFTDIPVTKNWDGSKTVTISLSNEAFQSIFGELISSAGSSASQGAAIESVMVSDATVKITVDKSGYIKSYKVSFDMSMSVGVNGASTTSSVFTEAEVTYVNPGKAVTVTPPAGYKNFPEADFGDYS